MLLHDNPDFRAALVVFINRQVMATHGGLVTFLLTQIQISCYTWLLGYFVRPWIVQLFVYAWSFWALFTNRELRIRCYRDETNVFWPIDPSTRETLHHALAIATHAIASIAWFQCPPLVWPALSAICSIRVLGSALGMLFIFASMYLLHRGFRLTAWRTYDFVAAAFIAVAMPGGILLKCLCAMYRLYLTRQIVRWRIFRWGIRPRDVYTYPSLALSSEEIRLLKISRKDGVMTCELEVHSRDSAPEYDAVSYTWRSSTLSYSLKIRNKWLAITESAKDVICELAPSAGTRYLWIDALCINQNNPTEKDNQIRIMRSIYESSYQTIACLGSSIDAYLAFEYLGLLEIHLHRRFAGNDPTIDPNNSIPLKDLHSQARAFRNLLKLPYWGRVWIIQELVVSNPVTILYGGFAAEFNSFATVIAGFNLIDNGAFVLAMDPAYGHLKSRQNAMLYVKSIFFLRTRCANNQSVTLPHLLIECCQAVSSYPQDKVFALVGISAEKDVASLQSDQQATVQDVYITAVEEALRTNCFSLLSIAGQCQPRQLELPSWVPDLSTPPTTHPLDHLQSDYFAGRPFDGSFELLENRAILAIEGVHVTGIRAVVPILPFFNSTTFREISFTNLASIMNGDVPLYLHAAMLQRAIQLLITEFVRDPYPHAATRQPRSEALWRTLIGDDSGGSFPAESSIGADFALYLAFLRMFDPRLSLPNGLPPAPDLRRVEQVDMAPLTASFGRMTQLLGRKIGSRQFAVTEDGHMALVPVGTRRGDRVAVFLGARVPHVLRQETRQGAHGEEEAYTLIGDCYVHGLMNGEVLAPKWNHLQETFRIR